jgi:hypothetical protein
MVKKAKKSNTKKSIAVETLRHESASRKNIPTMELQSLVYAEEAAPVSLIYQRRFNPDQHAKLYARNADLDPIDGRQRRRHCRMHDFRPLAASKTWLTSRSMKYPTIPFGKNG